jgi:hypothetical protein
MEKDLTKSIDSLIDDLFSEDVVKAAENFEVAPASKTTADAAIASAPKAENDESRGAGRPEDDHDVPEVDEDGNPAKGYEAVQKDQAEEEPEEAKKQAHAVTQVSSEGHLGEKPKMKDPRLSKSLSEEEYAEFQAFKKAQVAAKEKARQEELKKSEDLKKAEQENLIKSAIASALAPLRKENDDLKKAFSEQSALIKAMASQPRQAKSVTNIDALEKSQAPAARTESGQFTKSELLDAAEALYKSGKLPMEAVIELDNTSTILNSQYRKLVEEKLMNS